MVDALRRGGLKLTKMVDSIIETKLINRAMKDYECVACLWIENMCRNDIIDTLTFSELRSYARAKANGFKILKGQPYIREPMVCDGDFFVQRCIPEIRAINIKYDIWGE